MEERTVRAILRLMAVGMVFVGVALATQVLIVWIGAGGAFTGEVRFGMTSMLAQLMFATWGVVLYWASGSLAKRIVE